MRRINKIKNIILCGPNIERMMYYFSLLTEDDKKHTLLIFYVDVHSAITDDTLKFIEKFQSYIDMQGYHNTIFFPIYYNKIPSNYEIITCDIPKNVKKVSQRVNLLNDMRVVIAAISGASIDDCIYSINGSFNKETYRVTKMIKW